MELLHSFHLVPTLATICGGDATGFISIAAGLLGLGLVGGAVHCAPMCGPFVLMQLAEPGGGVAVQRLASSTLPGYQLGRLTTYLALGAAFGDLGGSAVQAIHWQPVAGVLLAMAALSFLGQALRSSGLLPASLPFAGIGAQLVTPLLGPIERLLRMQRLHLRGYALGLVLGFLPCGLLYTALLAAAATGGAVAGGLAMAAFAIGTMPALMTFGLLGAGALRRWRRPLSLVATPCSSSMRSSSAGSLCAARSEAEFDLDQSRGRSRPLELPRTPETRTRRMDTSAVATRSIATSVGYNEDVVRAFVVATMFTGERRDYRNQALPRHSGAGRPNLRPGWLALDVRWRDGGH